MSTIMEVTGLNVKDVKTPKGWKKVYNLTMSGMINGVTATLTLKSEDLDTLEDIAEFDKSTQRAISLSHVNKTLASYPGGPGQIQAQQSTLTPEELEAQEEQDQKETLEELRQQIYDAKGQEDQNSS